jgi:hypothetical protein
VVLGDATCHCLAGSPYLGSLVLALLAKYGQQDDAPVGCEEVGDSPGGAPEVEPQLEESVSE